MLTNQEYFYDLLELDLKEYVESENDLEEKKTIPYTFRRLWNELMPNLKFQPPASDLCDNCVQFKSKLQLTKRNIDEYNKVGAEFNEHKKRQT
ncbi:12741_t:CDS:2 [Entrophospora sp. SA101]|nr:12741_t:CDS:2 [Entrophospora sp. SA101]